MRLQCRQQIPLAMLSLTPSWKFHVPTLYSTHSTRHAVPDSILKISCTYAVLHKFHSTHCPSLQAGSFTRHAVLQTFHSQCCRSLQAGSFMRHAVLHTFHSACCCPLQAVSFHAPRLYFTNFSCHVAPHSKPEVRSP